MSRTTVADNNYLRQLVKKQIFEIKKINEQSNQEKDTEKEAPNPELIQKAAELASQNQPDTQKSKGGSTMGKTFSAVGDYLSQSAKGFKRLVNRQLYNNDREQAVSRIKSNDPDISTVKEFFSLYSAVCYESSTYLQARPKAMAIEDPGTYCVQPKIKNKLESWYKSNRQKFVKEMMDSSRTPEAFYEVCEEYAEDFLSTFDYFGLRIEAGEQKLTVSDSIATSILKMLLKDKRFTSNWRSQWHGRSPCVLDCFVVFYKFIYNLNFSDEDFPVNVSDIRRLGKPVAKSKSYLPVIKSQKTREFVNFIRREPEFRKKWTGFCYNLTFDPYGENSLDFWTDLSNDPLRQRDKKEHYDVYAENGVVLATDMFVMAPAIGAVAIKATNAITAAALGAAPLSGGTSVLVGLVANVAVGLLIWFDPFGWMTVQDDIQDELEEMISILENLKSVMSSEKDALDSKIDSIERDFRKSATNLYNIIHDTMTEGMQRDISNAKANFKDKKLTLAKLQRSLEILSRETRKVSFKKGKFDPNKLDETIKYYNILLKQLKSTGEDSKKWDNKIKNDVGLKDDVRGAENIDRAFLSPMRRVNEDVVDQTSPGPAPEGGSPSEDSVSNGAVNIENYQKWKTAFSKMYKWVDFENLESSLEQVRDWSDKELGPILGPDGKINNKKTGLKNIQSKVFQKLKKGNEPRELVNYSDFFTSWISNYSVYDETDKSPKEFTVFDSRWYLSSNGLRSRGGFTGNAVVPQEGALRAYAGIGLAHKLANTSFYYTSNNKIIQGFGDVTQGSSILSALKSRSRVDVVGDSVKITDGGVHISKLRNLVVLPKGDDSSEIVTLSKELEKELKRESNETTGSNRSKELRIMQMLLKVYYYKTASSLDIVKKILNKDDFYSKKMETYGISLARLPQGQQNGATHENLLSLLRQSACYKILLFEALMSFDF